MIEKRHVRMRAIKERVGRTRGHQMLYLRPCTRRLLDHRPSLHFVLTIALQRQIMQHLSSGFNVVRLHEAINIM